MIRLRSFLDAIHGFQVVVEGPQGKTTFQVDTLEEAKTRADFESQREGAKVKILNEEGEVVSEKGGFGALGIALGLGALVALPLLLGRE